MKKILTTLTILMALVMSTSIVLAAECSEGTVREEIETLTIPATGAKVTSTNSLNAEEEYLFEASGTCNWRTPGSSGGYLADAEYWLRNDAYGQGWTKMGIWSLSMWNEISPVGVEWGEYNELHVYDSTYLPVSNGPVTFFFNDDAYSDNSGSLTVKIYQCVDTDTDNDGVLDKEDLCDGTTNSDMPDVRFGVNRHIWHLGDEFFTTLIPGKKGKFNENPSEFSIADTYGCSCEQILDQMSEKTGFDFEGHYKFGCSKGLIKDWIAGKYYIGPTLIESVEIFANSVTPTSSIATLESGKDYFLEVSGTWANSQNLADAEFTSKNSWETNLNGYDIDPWYLGEGAFDLKVDNNFVDWGAYSSLHEYTYSYAGSNNKVNFLIFDGYSGTNTQVPEWYGDNSGSLIVDIIEDRWIDLW